MLAESNSRQTVREKIVYFLFEPKTGHTEITKIENSRIFFEFE